MEKRNIERFSVSMVLPGAEKRKIRRLTQIWKDNLREDMELRG